MAAHRLKDLLDFLAVVNAQAEHSEEKQKRLLEGCLRDFAGGPAIPMADCTMMIKDVQGASIPEWMKTAVVQSVQDKMLCTNGEQKKGSRGVMQRHNYLYNYFTKEDWEDLRSEAKGLSTKVQVFKRLFNAIGLTNPTEPTYVLANAILHWACYSGTVEEFQCDINRVFGVLQDLKAVVRAAAKRAKHSGLEVYPSDPMELPKDLKDKAYKDGAPVRCPLDVTSILDLTTLLPARATHAEVKHTRSRNHPFKASAGMRDANINNMLANVLMERLFNQQNGETPQAALTFLGGGNGQNLKRKRNPLALEDLKVDKKEEESTEQKEDDKQIAEQQDEKAEVANGNGLKPASVDAMAAAIQEQLETNKGNKPVENKTAPKAKIGQSQSQEWG